MRKLFERCYYALGPLATGLMLDVLDLATFGPLGLIAGALIGGFAGWWLGELEGLGRRGRSWLALAAGVYCTLPFTEVFPIATALGLAARFLKGSDAPEAKEEASKIKDPESAP